MQSILKNNKIKLLLLLLLVFATIFLTKKIAFPMGSINYDEPVYIYQAQTYIEGRIYNEIPTPQENFKQWFVIDSNGKRFGKYPFGTSLFYVVGIMIHSIDIILPIIAILNIYLIFLLASQFFTEKESLIIALIVFLNPYFIIHSSLTLSYTPSLIFVLATLLFFTKTIKEKNPLYALMMGFFLSMSFVTRPLTAIAISIPLTVIGIIYLYRNFSTYFKLFTVSIIGFLPLFEVSLLYNKILTGNMFTMPFSAWCDADKMGFGMRTQSWANKMISYHFFDAIKITFYQLKYVFIYLPLTFFSIFSIPYLRKKNKDLLILILSIAFILSHVGLNFFHFVAFTPFINLYGPSYYFELIPFFSVVAFLGLKYFYQLSKKNKFKISLIIILFLISVFSINTNFKKHYTLTKIIKNGIIDAQTVMSTKVKNENKKLLIFIGKMMPFISESLYLRAPQLINSPSLTNQDIIFSRLSTLDNNQKVIDKYGVNRELLELQWNSAKEIFEIQSFKNHLPAFEYRDEQCIEYKW